MRPLRPRRPPMTPAFLTAEWRDLLIANYEVAPRRLAPYLPAGTELDLFEGKALVSFVGFRFLQTRVLGCTIPGHVDFEEINLRFYVTRTLADGTRRRGVVFLGEIVPRRMIAWVARHRYGEPYQHRPMRQRPGGDALGYECRVEGEWQGISARGVGSARPATEDPMAAFITEHYWGYTRRSAMRTDEYEVTHPVWKVRDAVDIVNTLDTAALYGPDLADLVRPIAHSACIAEGSAVAVHRGVPLSVERTGSRS